MKLRKIALLLLVFSLIFPLSAQEVPPPTFFSENGVINAKIIVGSTAAASDVVAATEMAVFLSTKSYATKQIELEPEVHVSLHEGISSCNMTIDRPDTLDTLWFYDVPPWGTGDQDFQPWEAHEEIRVVPYDFPEENLGIFQPDGIMELLGAEQIEGIPSIQYVADNVRIPPKIWIDTDTPKLFTNHVTDLDYYGTRYFYLPDPEISPPKFKLFNTIYTVVDAGYFFDYDLNLQQYLPVRDPQAYVLTGTPEYYWEERILIGEPAFFKAHEVLLKDVDVDHNKAYIIISDYNQGTLFEGFMVLDPQHGFSPNLQQMGWTGLSSNATAIGRAQYDCVVTYETVEYTDDEGHRHLEYYFPTFVLDGIFSFMGASDTRGIQANIYELTDYHLLRDMYCCVPFVTSPENYSLKIYFSTTKTPFTVFDTNAYAIDEVVPEEYRDYDPEDYLDFFAYQMNCQDFMFEAVAALCDTVQIPRCETDYLFDGPQNYYKGQTQVSLEYPYFTVEFTDIETDDGFDYAVKQLVRKDSIQVKDPLSIEAESIIVLDKEFDFANWKAQGGTNLILIGGPAVNGIVKQLAGEGFSTIIWDVSLGTWEYIEDPYKTGASILIIAGKDREATRIATEELISKMGETSA